GPRSTWSGPTTTRRRILGIRLSRRSGCGSAWAAKTRWRRRGCSSRRPVPPTSSGSTSPCSASNGRNDPGMRMTVALLFLVSAPLRGEQDAASAVTFTKDVAPIVFARCADCHRPGEVAPFPLLEFGDVKKRAKQILGVVESGRMPTWKPVEGHGAFVGERRVKPGELATLRKWVDQGCVEGDAKDLPPLPKFPEGWAFGEPDLIVTMPEAYTVPAEEKDIIRAFVIPTGLAERKFVRATQFRAGDSLVVHHSLIYADASGESRRQDEEDPAPGFDGWKVRASARINLVGKWNP